MSRLSRRTTRTGLAARQWEFLDPPVSANPQTGPD